MCKNKTSCSCGCTKSVILKEGKIATTPISKGLQYHINTGKPLHKTIYRKNTSTYNKLFQEARRLYSRNLLEIKNPTDLKLIKDKNYGYMKEAILREYEFQVTQPNGEQGYISHKGIHSTLLQLSKFLGNPSNDFSWMKSITPEDYKNMISLLAQYVSDKNPNLKGEINFK